MKIAFVTKGSLNEVWQNNLVEICKQNVVVFGFNGLGLVSYKKELAGETEYFSDLAKLSRDISSVVISGCDTDTYGVFKKSVAIADNGRLLGVSDMAHTKKESEFSSGSGFRVYDTSAGKIGIIVGDDLYFPEVPRILSLCDADLIVAIIKTINSSIPVTMLKSGAFANGVTMGLVSSSYGLVSNIKGEIVFGGSAEILKTNILIEKDYHLINLRRRGLYRDFNSGY